MAAVYGISYERIPPNKIHAYGPGTNMKSITECARATNRTYKDFRGNAFFCRLDGTVNYDNADLFPRLYKEFGTSFTLAQVLAHEWGHVIQTQTGTEFPVTVLSEQQADCFAGAWVASVESGGSTRLDLAPGDLDRGLAGMLEFRDPPGGDPTAQRAHGSGFDRVNAFQQGVEGGAARCAQVHPGPSDGRRAAVHERHGRAPGWEPALPSSAPDDQGRPRSVLGAVHVRWAAVQERERRDLVQPEGQEVVAEVPEPELQGQ
jgi:hypothetical protein